MPAVFRCRLLNVAMPLLTVTVVVLLPVRLPGPLATATVTWSVLSVLNTWPNWSRISTVTAGLMAAPAVVLVGCCTKTREVAGAIAVTTKLLEAGPVRLPAFSLSV